jgi:AcrR family transcriptional regulator
MNGFERRKEQKKESIIRAALELFKQYGFKKVSINDVAGKAGVSPVTIYNHFNSKGGLVRDALRRLISDMMDYYKGIINGEGTFPEKMKSIVFDKTEIASQFRGELAMMVFSEDSEIKQFVEEILIQGGIQMMLELLEEGKREGYIGKYISEETLITYLDILRNGISSSQRLNSAGEAYPRLVRELNELFLYGLIDSGDRDEFHRDK